MHSESVHTIMKYWLRETRHRLCNYKKLFFLWQDVCYFHAAPTALRLLCLCSAIICRCFSFSILCFIFSFLLRFANTPSIKVRMKRCSSINRMSLFSSRLLSAETNSCRFQADMINSFRVLKLLDFSCLYIDCLTSFTSSPTAADHLDVSSCELPLYLRSFASTAFQNKC